MQHDGPADLSIDHPLEELPSLPFDRLRTAPASNPRGPLRGSDRRRKQGARPGRGHSEPVAGAEGHVVPGGGSYFAPGAEVSWASAS